MKLRKIPDTKCPCFSFVLQLFSSSLLIPSTDGVGSAGGLTFRYVSWSPYTTAPGLRRLLAFLTACESLVRKSSLTYRNSLATVGIIQLLYDPQTSMSSSDQRNGNVACTHRPTNSATSEAKRKPVNEETRMSNQCDLRRGITPVPPFPSARIPLLSLYVLRRPASRRFLSQILALRV